MLIVDANRYDALHGLESWVDFAEKQERRAAGRVVTGVRSAIVRALRVKKCLPRKQLLDTLKLMGLEEGEAMQAPNIGLYVKI